MTAAESKKLDQILEMLTEIKVSNATRDEEYRQLKENVDKHSLDLEGNGKPGLKADVELIKATLSRVSYMAGALTITLITAIGGFLWALLTHTVELVKP